MSSSSELALSSGMQQRMRQEYQSLRQQSQQSHDKMVDYINQHSEAERQTLEAAAAALARKREQLLATQPMLQHRTQFESSQEGMLRVEQKLAELQRQAFVKIQKLQATPAEKQALWEKVEKGIEAVLYSDDEMKAMAALRSQVQQALAGMGMVASGEGSAEAGAGGGSICAAGDAGENGGGTKCIRLAR